MVGVLVVSALILTSGFSPEAQATLTVFVAAIWLWVFGSLNDTYVALGAASALVLANVLSAEEFFAALGDDTTWLLYRCLHPIRCSDTVWAGSAGNGLA